MLDKQSQYELAIAALFHDIGKFKQRAYKGDESIFRESTSSMEGYIAKLNIKTKFYTHRHSLWTYDFFIEDFKPIIDKIDFDINLKWEKIFISSASHHNPGDDNYSNIIQLADSVSSNNDRGNSGNEYKRGDYYKKPLRSIFTNINTETNDPPKQSEYFYHLTMSDKGTNYPLNIPLEEMKLDYKILWDDFLNSLKQLPNKMTILEFLMKLKDVFYQYTWCIPSATNDCFNDISLYDHSVTTLSFALAIANSTDINKIRIFASDISGIQQFIFQSKYSSFKGAAKTFRGRSFIISSISNAYKIALCEKLGIIPFIDLIDAGGKFTMILPSDEELVPLIDQFVKEQDLFFFKKYQGTLCVLSDYSLKVDLSAFAKNQFPQTQKEIGYLLNSKKTRKFESCIHEIGSVIHDVDIDGSRCTVCGKNVVSKADKQICSNCDNIQKLGANILTNSYICYNRTTGYEIVKDVFVIISNDINYNLFYCYSLEKKSNKYPKWRLNTHSPNQTFDKIAETSINDEGQGKNFLAYVKIDVDNLGEIFIGGFSPEIYSISRYVTLSRLLNHFFNVIVKNILEKDYPEAYTVISGGDDVFIILPWNQALSFIEDLKLKFRLFCCNNKHINFSTGIVVGHAKEPFALLNEKANFQLEENAKEADGKNSTSYFNVLFNENELKGLIEDSNKLKKYIDENLVSSSFIYRIYNYINDLLIDVDRKKRNNVFESPSDYTLNDNRKKWSVQSKLRYDLVRNVKVSNEEEKGKIFDFFLNHLDNYKDYYELERFRVALIHTMYGLRKN